jgi:hypothetical protein
MAERDAEEQSQWAIPADSAPSFTKRFTPCASMSNEIKRFISQIVFYRFYISQRCICSAVFLLT